MRLRESEGAVKRIRRQEAEDINESATTIEVRDIGLKLGRVQGPQSLQNAVPKLRHFPRRYKNANAIMIQNEK